VKHKRRDTALQSVHFYDPTIIAVMSTTEQIDYFLESDDKISRLSNQHHVIKDEMGGLVFAPVDLSARPLRILDSATADGMRI
jgi:hypothetical protein